jgi:ATP-binding cassette subfamily B protein
VRLITMLLLFLASTGLTLLNPLILRDLIDNTIPAKDTSCLVWLAIVLLIIPILNGGINVVQRLLNARVG